MAIVGNGDSVLAFRAVGVDAFSVTDIKKAEELIKTLAKEYKIIFITEDIAEKLDEVIKRYLAEPYPIILPIPYKKDGNGYGMEGIKRAMDKALGVDIFIDEKK